MSVVIAGGKAIYKINRNQTVNGVLDKMSIKDIASFLYIEEFDSDKVVFVNIAKNIKFVDKMDNRFGAAVLRKSTLKYGDLLLDFQPDCLLDGKETSLLFPTGNFLTYSSFIETLSFHLCSLYGAASYLHLLLRQSRYAKLDQIRRIEKINEICFKSTDEDEVKKQESQDVKELQNIAEVRNQIAHNFLPGFIIYKEKAYHSSDKELFDILVSAIKKTTSILLKYYARQQDIFLVKNNDDICKEFMIDFDESTKRLIFPK